MGNGGDTQGTCTVVP